MRLESVYLVFIQILPFYKINVIKNSERLYQSNQDTINNVLYHTLTESLSRSENIQPKKEKLKQKVFDLSKNILRACH